MDMQIDTAQCTVTKLGGKVDRVLIKNLSQSEIEDILDQIDEQEWDLVMGRYRANYADFI